MLSFPQGTEMFQFPWFPPPVLCVQTGVTPHDGCRVSPFGHPRINARSTATRGFSQSPTSFIGSRRQGIHRWLFVAWKNKFFKMLVLALQFSRGAEVRPVQRSPNGLDAAADSLKTEERTLTSSWSRRWEPKLQPHTRSRTAPPVHQRRLPRRHRPEWPDITRKCSLERR